MLRNTALNLSSSRPVKISAEFILHSGFHTQFQNALNLPVDNLFGQTVLGYTLSIKIANPAYFRAALPAEF